MLLQLLLVLYANTAYSRSKVVATFSTRMTVLMGTTLALLVRAGPCLHR
jgi:hypothetical protein